MSYTLDQMRVYVRQHLDLDESEIPNSLLDVWARDASIKIARTRKRWPFLETSWEITTVPDQRDYAISALSPTCDEIISVVRYNNRLQFMGRDQAEAAYLPYQVNSGYPMFYNVWNDTLRIYPTPTTVETLYLRGYRKVTDWVADGSGAVPDFPDEFHDAIRLYLVGMAYLQQEDPQMAQQFIGAFNSEMDLLKKQFGDAPGAYPLVLGGGPRIRLHDGLRYPFDNG